MPACSRSSLAARAESAQPTTLIPLCDHASLAASWAKVFSAPAGARTTSTARAGTVGEQVEEPSSVEAVLRRAGAPLVAQPVDRHLVVLALARRQRRGLGGEEGVLATASQLANDLRAAPREVLDQLAGEAGE